MTVSLISLLLRAKCNSLASTTLCFDFGNTRMKAALFVDSVLKEMIMLQDGSYETINALLEKFQPQKAILSSVINHDSHIEDLLLSKTKFHKLNHLTKLPFTAPVNKPDTIGADRLALSAAA